MLRIVYTLLFSTLFIPLCAIERGAYYNHVAFNFGVVFFKCSHPYTEHITEMAKLFKPQLNDPDKEKDKGIIISTKELTNKTSYAHGITGICKLFPNIWSTWEIGYMGNLSWKAEKTWYGLEELKKPSHVQETSPTFSHYIQGTYHSKMCSTAINYYRQMTPRYIDYFSFAWGIGIKNFNIDETMNLSFVNTNPIKKTTNLFTGVKNRALGPQFALCFACNPYSFLTWGLIAKTGILLNRIRYHKLIDQKSSSLPKEQFSYICIGHIYPFIELHLTEYLFIEINYQVIGIGNVKTADPHNTHRQKHSFRFSDNGAIIYSGLNGSIQWNF